MADRFCNQLILFHDALAAFFQLFQSLRQIVFDLLLPLFRGFLPFLAIFFAAPATNAPSRLFVEFTDVYAGILHACLMDGMWQKATDPGKTPKMLLMDMVAPAAKENGPDVMSGPSLHWEGRGVSSSWAVWPASS
jgi:hypothetical protein